MPQCRISAAGQERREITFTEGETLGGLFARIGVDIPSGAGIEVWVNGESTPNWQGRPIAHEDAIVLMSNLKGA
jgi:hypothetical protein